MGWVDYWKLTSVILTTVFVSIIAPGLLDLLRHRIDRQRIREDRIHALQVQTALALQDLLSDITRIAVPRHERTYISRKLPEDIPPEGQRLAIEIIKLKSRLQDDQLRKDIDDFRLITMGMITPTFDMIDLARPEDVDQLIDKLYSITDRLGAIIRS